MTEREQLKVYIEDYLRDAKMMQLATVSDDKPWVCNVWFGANKDMDIYWFSSTTRKHSHDIKNNPHVAGAICVPQTPNDKDSYGLQFEGVAHEVTNLLELADAMKSYVGRIFSLGAVNRFMADLDTPHRFYKVEVSKFALFDTEHYPENSQRFYEK